MSETSGKDYEKTNKKDEKKRGSLSLTDLILFGLGNVVGAGIFIIISKTILHGGNKSLHALLTIAVISITMGFCYTEIYGRYSSSITEYLAVRDTLGEGIGQITLYAIYMFALLSGVTIVTAMSKYVCKCDLVSSIKQNMLWTTDSHHSVFETAFTIAVLFIIAIINYLGIETSKIVANTISIIMLVVILGIIVLSLPYIKMSKINVATPQIDGSDKLWDNFVLSAILSLFLYNGYDFLIKISDESENPEDNKTALISTISITTLLYMGVIIAGICVLGYRKAGNSHNIITNLYELLTNSKLAAAVYTAGLFIMFNTGFLSIMSATKFMEGLGKNNNIFMSDFWAQTNEYDAPHNAIYVTIAICIFFALFNNETLMAIFSNFTCIAILILISIALLILRWKEKDNVEAQLKYNYIWGNVSNIPIPIIANLGVLLYIMYEMISNKFWIHVV